MSAAAEQSTPPVGFEQVPPADFGDSPEGFEFVTEDEQFLNDIDLHSGPSLYHDELKIGISTSWTPDDGITFDVDVLPRDYLTLAQARWLAAELPSLLEGIDA
ncbi:hypothetical protein [uncultured Arthrobacter sp.]|uniref:hypothetical protein n=1 Tax=uncultured Arthrobacter sp. TaxID=114050 RepID=UPI00260C0E2D|nr:hypothetical protein [uncultured Arthrobacter sp.]